MSKFADKLRGLSTSSASPIGFHSAASKMKGSAMLLIASLSGQDAKEVETIVNSPVDAVLVWERNLSNENLGEMIKAVGDVPLGVLLQDASGDKMKGLLDSGCDFVVFNTKAPVAVFQDERAAKFLMIESSMDQGMVRAIGSLDDVDGVFTDGSEGAHIDVEHVLIYRKFIELLNKPLLVALPSSITSAELVIMRNAGVKAIVAPPAQSARELEELRKMIDDLPRRARQRQSKATAVLPHYDGGADVDEDEEI